MKIQATKDSFGFRNTYWYKGDVTELGKGEKMPSHFEPLDKPAKGGQDQKDQKSGNNDQQ